MFVTWESKTHEADVGPGFFGSFKEARVGDRMSRWLSKDGEIFIVRALYKYLCCDLPISLMHAF
jgi:hypothetical protein